MLAFLLDGGRKFHPELPVQFAAYLAPVVTLLCCLLIMRNRKWLSYAVGAAVASAAVLIVPLYRVLVNVYDDAFETDEVLLFWFLVGFPFAAIAICVRAMKKEPNQSPVPTRGNGT